MVVSYKRIAHNVLLATCGHRQFGSRHSDGTGARTRRVWLEKCNHSTVGFQEVCKNLKPLYVHKSSWSIREKGESSQSAEQLVASSLAAGQAYAAHEC